MVDAPKRIYADHGPRGGLLYRELRMPDTVAEYVRSDLFADVQSENERLTRELETTSKLKRQYLHAATYWYDRAEASGAVKVDTLRLLLSHFERIESLPAGEHPHYPSGVRPWGVGDVKCIADDLRRILSVLTAPQEPCSTTKVLEAELEWYSKTEHGALDGIPYKHVAHVIRHMLSCIADASSAAPQEAEAVAWRVTINTHDYITPLPAQAESWRRDGYAVCALYTSRPAQAVTEAQVEAALEAFGKAFSSAMQHPSGDETIGESRRHIMRSALSAAQEASHDAA